MSNFLPTSMPSLKQRLTQALANAPTRRATGLISISLPLITAATPVISTEPSSSWIYWARPDLHQRRQGWGRAIRILTRGPQRLSLLAKRFRPLAESWFWADPFTTQQRPAAFVGFAFDQQDPMQGFWQGFPNSILQVPELLLQQQADNYTLIFSTQAPIPDQTQCLARWLSLVEPLISGNRRQRRLPATDSGRLILDRQSPSANDWETLVSQAVSEIQHGNLEKLVPARKVRYRMTGSVDPATLTARLEQLFPNCRLVTARFGAPTLLAATPECLVSRTGNRITCDAVAGTIGRAGRSVKDRKLGQSMLADRKMRQEHAMVVNAIGRTLTSNCRDLHLPEQPEILRLRNLQHLWTQVSGTLDSDTGLLDIAAHLHPTPAVNGTPAPAALDWIRANEPIHRGWYCGGAGWIDCSGDGEISTLVRCGIMHDDQIELYAGAGVLADSNPAAELRETELKLDALRGALGGETLSTGKLRDSLGR